MNKFKCLLIFLLFLIFPNQSSYASSLPQETLPEFNAISVGFHNLYEITVSIENGQTVARSIYDPADSPHYSYDSETQTWVDNHPGRNDIEQLFPPQRDSGRSIWVELAGNVWDEASKSYTTDLDYRAEWNQEMNAYEYVDMAHDEGHPKFWLPQMAIRETEDEDRGMVNFAERAYVNDPELGELTMDFLISTDHPYIEYWENRPTEIAGEALAKMYLENFPWLAGKHIQVKWIMEDVTPDNKFPLRDRDIFFHGNFTSTEGLVVGYTENISSNFDSITVSISKDMMDSLAIHWATIWTLNVKEKGGLSASDYEIQEKITPLNDFINKLYEENSSEAFYTKLK